MFSPTGVASHRPFLFSTELSSLHDGQPGGGPDLLCVLLAVLRPARSAVFPHLLQELPGQPAPGVQQLLHLASAAAAHKMSALPKRGGAAPKRRGHSPVQRISASHR